MSFAKGRRAIDMTSGPLLGKIILFVLPLMATNLLQTFYNAADMMIVGLSPEPDAVGAVGSTSAFLNLVVNIFIGIAVGADVIVARCIGAGDSKKASAAVHTSVCMSLILGVAGGLVGFALSEPVLVAMGYEGKLLQLGVRYARIYFGCLPFLSMTNFLSAIMRAKGDTHTPLCVMLGAGLLNVGLNLFFVLVCRFSVEGVAIATAISNATSAAVLWYVLSRDEGPCRISLRWLRISGGVSREILLIGLPAGVQNAFFSLSNMLIQTAILQIDTAVTPAGSAYAPVIKANSAGASIEGFVFTALNSLMQAASTFTSQNVGKGDYKRVRRVFGTVCLISSVLAVVLSAAIVLLRQPLYALYDVRDLGDTLSTIAYDTAMKRVWYKWTPFILFGLMNSAAGVLRGLGRSLMSASFSLVGTCVFRVVWIYTVFKIFPTLESIYLSYPISWMLTGSAFFIAVGVLLKGRIRETAQ